MPCLSLNYLWSKKTPVQYTEEEEEEEEEKCLHRETVKRPILSDDHISRLKNPDFLKQLTLDVSRCIDIENFDW